MGEPDHQAASDQKGFFGLAFRESSHLPGWRLGGSA